MKIKRIRKIKINCYEFKIKWDGTHGGGSFSYGSMEIEIGTKDRTEEEIFMVVCHEIVEIVAVEMNVRFQRPDCDSDYIFVYDHRQHETMTSMLAGLLSQFID
jgi:hypothetical protein